MRGAENEKVRLDAAKEIVTRCLGKVPDVLKGTGRDEDAIVLRGEADAEIENLIAGVASRLAKESS